MAVVVNEQCNRYVDRKTEYDRTVLNDEQTALQKKKIMSLRFKQVRRTNVVCAVNAH